MNGLNAPLYINWIEDDQPHWPGKLGLTIAPGKKGQKFGRTHARDLSADLQVIKDAGANLLVNLMEVEEGQHWHMHNYDSQAARIGLNVRRYPIQDVNVPSDPTSFRTLVQELHTDLQDGDTIVIHCLGGLGRSGTLAACLLIQNGMNSREAINLVRTCRPGAIEARQPEFVETYAQTLTR